MAIKLKTHKMLWGRAASICSFPGCHLQLVMDASETDDESLVGEACHIVGESPSGPRGASDLSLPQRDKYENLILMCNVHHKLVDDQPGTYTVEVLRGMKKEHEEWVQRTLVTDPMKQRDDEQYASLVDEWASRVELAEWDAWTSLLLSPTPHLLKEYDKSLEDTRLWLFNRIWPKRYPDLDAALQNFLQVCWDLTEVFHQHAESHGIALYTSKFYHIDSWDPPLYNRLLKDFEFHVGLLQDLVLELTRAANYVCDHVRVHLDSTYRLKEGVVFVARGDVLSVGYHRPEYRGEERSLHPYPGLDQFKIGRESRDVSYGRGSEPDYSDVDDD